MLERSTVEATTLGNGVGPLVLEHARWLQVTFEVPRRAALACLPSNVTRPIPCYGRLFAAEGTVNAESVTFGVVMVGCRFMMMPRNTLVTGVASSGVVSEVLTNGIQPGSVAFDRDGARLQASLLQGASRVAAASLPGLYAVEPSMLRWDPWLAFAEQDGQTVVTEVPVTPEINAAFLSKGATVEPDGALPRNHPVRQLRNLLTISACYAEGTLTFGAPRIVDECS